MAEVGSTASAASISVRTSGSVSWAGDRADRLCGLAITAQGPGGRAADQRFAVVEPADQCVKDRERHQRGRLWFPSTIAALRSSPRRLGRHSGVWRKRGGIRRSSNSNSSIKSPRRCHPRPQCRLLGVAARGDSRGRLPGTRRSRTATGRPLRAARAGSVAAIQWSGS